MSTTLKHLRTAVLAAAMLAIAGSLAAQAVTNGRVRKHSRRIFAAQTGPDQVTLAWDVVPGATEYRIYLPDPNRPGPPVPGARPWSTLSGSGRRATVMGVQRLSAGAYLEAVADGEVLYRGTFNAVARAPLTPVTPPGSVRAQETGETEVTLSWSPVPGATAYTIARSVGGSGLSMLCDICPAAPEFVDTTAVPGLQHAYTVAAVFPLGVSARAPSNRLTVGAAQLAAATAASQATTAVWDKPMSSGTPVPGTDADPSNTGAGGTGTTPPSGSGTTTGPTTGCPPTNPLIATGSGQISTKMMASGTPVPGTGADPSNTGAGGTGTSGSGPTTGCPTTGGTTTGGPTTGGSTTGPTTGTGTPTGSGGNPGAPGGVSGQPTTWTPPGTPAGTGSTTPGGTGTTLLPPTRANATVNGVPAGAAWITWGPSPSSGVTGYTVYHNINGGPFTLVQALGSNAFGTRDTAFTAAQFAAGPVNAAYRIVAVGAGGVTSGPSNTTYAVTIQPPAPPAPPPCKLNYQRADNMWAAFGRPDGFLGTESISLPSGQTKVFITDWAYEKKTNDGTNYYGSHLRVATNPGAGVVRLRTRNPASAVIGGIAANLAQKLSLGWLVMKPGERAEFSDDLMEVHCEP